MKIFIKNPVFIIGVVSVVAIIGVLLWIKHQDLRHPAAISKVEMFDYSSLSGEPLHEAIAKQIIKDSTLNQKEHSFQFNFSNFIVDKQNNEPSYVCDYYDHYTLTFEAEGMAVNGERPRMLITSPCKLSGDLKTVSPVVIPSLKIREKKAGDIDWTYDKQPDVIFSFRNIDGFWPNHWVLSNINLSSKQDAARDLNLNREMIYKYSDIPPLMVWETK